VQRAEGDESGNVPQITVSVHVETERKISVAKARELFAAFPGLHKVYSKELIEMIFRQPYCKIQFVVDAGIAKRQTASEYLQQLEGIGVLTGERRGREIIYKHPALVEVLTA
jgi:Fic family protein